MALEEFTGGFELRESWVPRRDLGNAHHNKVSSKQRKSFRLRNNTRISADSFQNVVDRMSLENCASSVSLIRTYDSNITYKCIIFKELTANSSMHINKKSRSQVFYGWTRKIVSAERNPLNHTSTLI